MKSRVAIAFAIAGLFAWQAPAIGQVNEKFADMAPEITLLRNMVQVERKNFVALDMELTDAEAAGFWPVYESYRKEIVHAHDGLVKVITDYAAQRDTLTDGQAGQLLTEFLAVEQRMLKTRKKYVGRFGKVLPMTKVVRFFQIDNKLDAVSRLVLAREVPLTR